MASPIASPFVSHEDIQKEEGLLFPEVNTLLEPLPQRFKSGADSFLSRKLTICNCETHVAPNYQTFFSHFDIAFSTPLRQP